MRKAVLENVFEYQRTFEGCIDHLYCDILGLVTTGVGNLVDPKSIAMGWMFRWRSMPGRLATPKEIGVEWDKVKAAAAPDPSQKSHLFYRAITSLFLDREYIEERVDQTAKSFVILLADDFPDWNAWPADAQMGVLGVVWAVGPGKMRRFFPRFMAACKAQEWIDASHECLVNATKNAGVVPRNRNNRALFKSAAAGGDPEKLNWPMAVAE